MYIDKNTDKSVLSIEMNFKERTLFKYDRILDDDATPTTSDEDLVISSV